jgi:hypothetical protein
MATSLTQAATAAAQFLHVLDPGESLSAQQLADALAACNNMLDSWSSDEGMILASTELSFNTAAGTQSYTIGPGMTIASTPAPRSIKAASASLTAGPGAPLSVVDLLQWNQIPDRQSQSWHPKFVYHDHGSPTGIIYLSPVPIGILAVKLDTWTALTQFADTTTPITILPGYLRLIELGLALELAPQYVVTPSQTLVALFADALGKVKGLNAKIFGGGAAAPGNA